MTWAKLYPATMQMASRRVNTRRERTRLARTATFCLLPSRGGSAAPAPNRPSLTGSLPNPSLGSDPSTQQPPLGQKSRPLSTQANCLRTAHPRLPSVPATGSGPVRTSPYSCAIPNPRDHCQLTSGSHPHLEVVRPILPSPPASCSNHSSAGLPRSFGDPGQAGVRLPIACCGDHPQYWVLGCRAPKVGQHWRCSEAGAAVYDHPSTLGREWESRWSRSIIQVPSGAVGVC